MQNNSDVAIMDTAVDSLSCKLSASSIGYYKDPYVQLFCKKLPQRRMPLINRGYYARVASIQTLVERFIISHSAQKDIIPQIVVLGAGFDTMYFRLRSKEELKSMRFIYFESDLSDVTMKKISVIRRHPLLYKLLHFDTLQEFDYSVKQQNSRGFTCPDRSYHLLAIDLRNWSATVETLIGAGFDTNKPTLFVSECVLIYLEAQYSDAILNWINQEMQDANFILYEQILPQDSFGRVMMENIRARGCALKSIDAYPTKEVQIERFRKRGFRYVECWDMNEIYYKYLDSTKRQRKEKLEIFDELEEFHLLQAHYCIVTASQQKTSAQSIALTICAE